MRASRVRQQPDRRLAPGSCGRRVGEDDVLALRRVCAARSAASSTTPRSTAKFGAAAPTTSWTTSRDCTSMPPSEMADGADHRVDARDAGPPAQRSARRSTRSSASTTSVNWYTARARRRVPSQGQRWGLGRAGSSSALGATMAVLSLGNIEGLDPFGARHPARRGRLTDRGRDRLDPGPAVRQPRGGVQHRPAGADLDQRLLARPIEDEADWTAFVDSAEGAISREHTMWRAARAGGVG